MIVLDGGAGEGGGQIVRSAVTLSAITQLPVRIVNIRAGRSPSGLRPQHVTAIQAVAQICGAELEGVAVGAHTITFVPGHSPRPGSYRYSVGTAGSASLVFQTVVLPLALADGPSEVLIDGGTHVSGSPSGHYLRDVYAPALLDIGVDVQAAVERLGWMPEGGGRWVAYIAGNSHPRAIEWIKRGPLERVSGVAAVSNLPAHIPQRMTNRALNLLGMMEDALVDIRPVRARGESTGAGSFLAAEYRSGRGGVGILGKRGMPSEAVAEYAIDELHAFMDSQAAVDAHLADQIVIPLALAQGASEVTLQQVTPHLRTNVEVVRAFLERDITIDERKRLLRISS